MKVYVQHRLKERAQEVNELLEKKAYIYVCGDAANMAREVNTVLAQIISEKRGIPESKAEEIVKNMRATNQYQVGHTTMSTTTAYKIFLSFVLSSLARLQHSLSIILTMIAGGCLVVRTGGDVMCFLMHDRVSVADRRNCIEEVTANLALESGRCDFYWIGLHTGTISVWYQCASYCGSARSIRIYIGSYLRNDFYRLC